jgi:uncharacterized membrane protein YebE (DUF533 family)
MIDAQKLLDQFLGTHGGSRRAMPPHGSGGGLGGDLGRIAQAALSGRSGGGTSGLGGLVGQVLGGGAGSRSGGGGLAGKAIGGALAGGLASQLLKGKATKGLGGSALKLGGLALVAGLGYKAWTNYQAQQDASRAGQGAAPLPRPVGPTSIPSAAATPFQPRAEEAEERARLLLSAMIAAAKADGYIDRDEEAAIFGRIDDLDLEPDEKGALMDELRRPLSIDELVRRTPSHEVAVEVYTASVIAIDPDHPAERAYLDMLAARLDLDPALVAEIRRTTDEARER